MSVLDQLDDIVADRVDQLKHRSAVLVGELSDRLPEWGLPVVRGGLSLWARLPHGSAAAFARYAARFGVAVAGGREFTASQTVDDHIRIPFTAPEPLLHDGVKRLSQAWAAFVTGPARRTRRAPRRGLVPRPHWFARSVPLWSVTAVNRAGNTWATFAERYSP